MNIKSKIVFRFKRLKSKIQKKETQEDKKLQKNREENREVKVINSNSNYYEYNAFLVYANNYEKIVSLYDIEKDRKYVERNISEIKILIESTIDKHFLDSLNFFHTINNQSIDRMLFIQTSFVKTSFLFSPSEDEEKVYLLISGSIGDYIKLFDHYYNNYSNERNKIIKSLIDILNYQIPVVRDQYEELNIKYNLNMKGLEYGETVVNDNELIENASKLRNEGFAIYDIDFYQKSVLIESLDNKIKKILDLFIKDEISKGEFNIVYFVKEEEDYSPCIRKNSMFKLSYLITPLDNSDHIFSEYKTNILTKIKQQVCSMMKTSQTITYSNFKGDNAISSEQLSMYDLVDEIIK